MQIFVCYSRVDENLPSAFQERRPPCELMTTDILVRVLLILVIISAVLDLNVLLIARRRPELRWVAKAGMLATMLALLSLLVLWFSSMG